MTYVYMCMEVRLDVHINNVWNVCVLAIALTNVKKQQVCVGGWWKGYCDSDVCKFWMHVCVCVCVC